jgi:fructose-1,6-bisphosphatase
LVHLLILTKQDNQRVIRIAARMGLHDLGEYTDPGTGKARRMFETAPIALVAHATRR